MKVLKRIYHFILYVIHIFGYFFLHPIAYLFFGRKRPWIVSEIDFDARDNGMHFYKYLCEYHKEISAYYIISRKNISIKKIRELGKTVEPYSLKHWLVFIASRVKLSTIINGCAPSYYIQLFLMKKHCSGLNVSLKHGIIKDLHPNYYMRNAHLDMICCGSPVEANYINTSFEYNFEVAICTGLARFDNLFNKKPSNYILIMPTWRRWLDDCSNDVEFEQSEFYQKWHEFLSGSDLHNLLSQNNLTVIFYLHPKLNRHIKLFNFLKESEHIEVANSKEDDDLQGYIIKSKLLITDYSSVFFDFAYSKKPVIYYQFDEERFHKFHYSKGYFEYRHNGFGPVVTNAQELINELTIISNDNFVPKVEYLDRTEKFFTYYDGNSCQRIYDEILLRMKKATHKRGA